MFRRERIDSRARRVALLLAATRVGMGVAILASTRPVLRAFGFGEAGPTGMALGRLGGGRDLAIGAMTLVARDDRERLRTLLLVSSACDVADAAALGASARHPETRTAGVGGVLSGSAAALAGLWAWRRLGG